MGKGIFERVDKLLGFLFMVPAMLVIALVSLYPISYTIFISFTNAHLLYGISRMWILKNYVMVLKEPRFWFALVRTLVWLGGCLSIQLVVSFILALLLDQPIKGKKIFQTLVILPWAFSSVAFVFTWKWLLHPVNGVVNHLLIWLGILSHSIPWISTKAFAMLSCINMYVWFGVPFMTLCLTAGLQGIPQSDYDVAQIEGASYLQTLYYVILPRLWTIIGVVVILRSIWIFNNFDIIFLATGGGPVNYTETLPIYAYKLGWERHLMGRSSVVSTLMLIVLTGFIFVYFKLYKISRAE